MVYPQIPLWGVIIFPIIFIYLIIFTDIRYNFSPEKHIGNSTTFASLVIGFILYYAMQKFDGIDLNVPTVNRGLLYLKKIAMQYEPKAVCYLIDYAKGFLSIDKNNFSLECFERLVVPKIPSKTERQRVETVITTLENIYYQRVSELNVIAEPIWYLVFLSGILLSIIFPMNDKLPKLDAILVLLLIWLPIGFIYSLYLSELSSLTNIMNNTIEELKVCTMGLNDYCESLNCRYKCKYKCK